MKNLKSLILGSAAGMLAVAGAQAADLPVKAKPVEYVKVCSAYGAGFYYIPGTDICLRVGGFLYSEFAVNDRSHAVQFGASDVNRQDDRTSWRIRQALIIDARTNTEYGTLRSYFVGGMQWDTSTNGLPNVQTQGGGLTQNWSWYYSAAFIQFAGFTFGIANSFFDFDGTKILNSPPGVDTAKSSPMIGYTAQLGSGISASIAMEDSTLRRKAIRVGNVSATFALGGVTVIGPGLNNAYASQYMPDFVANLRVDQAWGDAQVSGAIHQVQTSTNLTPSGLPAGNNIGSIAPEKWGYAFLGGLNFKLPQTGAGDNFQIQGVWARGAVAYNDPEGSNYNVGNAPTISYRLKGNSAPRLELFDSFIPIVGAGTGAQSLTKSYSLDAEFRHFWTTTLRSSFAYILFNEDVSAAANAAGYSDGRIQTAAVNLIWSPVKNLDLGTEVYYANLKTTNSAVAPAAGINNGLNTNGSQSWWGGVFKATRYW